jgi:branched-chain amino acid transport system ATP-binding protein
MCTIPEGRGVFPSLTVRENLRMATYAGVSRAAVEEIACTRFPALRNRLNQTAGTLSGGEQQMLAIGRALMANPKMLLLDEPSMGLAPLVVQEIFRVLERLRRENGTTILLVEQNAKAALKLADRGYVLETGKVILEGPADELLENAEVKRAYLGKDKKEMWER